MYFTKLQLIGLSTVNLPIVDALPTDPYILTNAEGLGPPEVDVSIQNTLNAGGFYQGRRPQSREIVLRVGLNPDFGIGQTAADLRTELYGLLTPGYLDNVTVRIMDVTTVLATTVGYIKKLEIVPFNAEPEVQITIACVEQYLQAPSFLYVAPDSKSAPVIDNTGTAPAGFRMEITFTSNVTNWTLSHASGAKMELTYSFLSGDILTIDTRPGYRGIWLKRGLSTTNIIYALSADSIWFMLHGGENTFATSSSAFNWGDVYYRPQYWGV